MDADPWLRIAEPWIDRVVAGAGGATRAAAGLRDDGAVAVFWTRNVTYTIWPVADRDRFLAAHRGQPGADGIDRIEFEGLLLQCRTHRGVYACADHVAQLDQLGTGSLDGALSSAVRRGAIEIVAKPAPNVLALATITSQDGTLRVWARVESEERMPLPHSPGVTIGADPIAAMLGISLPPDAINEIVNSLHPGAMTDALAGLRGQVGAYVPSGAEDLVVRIPFTSTDAATRGLSACDAVPPQLPIRVRRDGDICRVGHVQFPGGELVAWAADSEIRMSRSRGSPTAGTGPATTALGRDLASQPWTFVVWGRGHSLSWIAPPPIAMSSTIHQAAFRIPYLTEIGLALRAEPNALTLEFGVRTVLSYPAPIDSAAPRWIARAAAGDDVSAEVTAALANSPSMVSDDAAAGLWGVSLAASGLGMMIAIAEPPVRNYLARRSRP